MKLNKGEKKLLDSVERGEWRTIPNFNEEAKQYQEYAKPIFRTSSGPYSNRHDL